eukprot:CAMPEP_0116565534 /NCGR_PEP_ID=MMETSP0397-20121206/13952_1 /TAXON_ID=216820 /ORGANISM="Cyclophora tenuis, Strain ECT3854" /LENGTH=173 /DNA_ID=CAMNT_0004092319 /DNA_START=34 /DNA_END=555 /DNA_ORIENTATION=+
MTRRTICRDRTVGKKEYVRDSVRMLEMTFDDSHDGWTMLPKLFKVWDLDGNGFIDQRELFVGLGRYCRKNNVALERQKILNILMLVDINHDHRLDEREFSIFLARFADSMNIPLFDLCYAIMEQLAHRENEKLEAPTTPTTTARTTETNKRTFGVFTFFKSLQDEQVRRSSLA